MRKSLTLVAASLISVLVADVASAQPRPYNDAWRAPSQSAQGGDRGQNYYYNGRWVGPDEWQRQGQARDRWAQNYQRRRGRSDNGDSSALIAGIIGFALGAAITGSQQQADHARTADSSWDSYCARKYRSYDRRSRTFLGNDGLRHYCQ